MTCVRPLYIPVCPALPRESSLNLALKPPVRLLNMENWCWARGVLLGEEAAGLEVVARYEIEAGRGVARPEGSQQR